MSLFDEINSLGDIQRLIDSDERESETLEYKTASTRLQPSDRQEAAKDISAFANSLGGVLIYGVATAQTDKTKPERIEPIEPANVDFLLHTPSSSIRHPIAGIRTKTYPVGEPARVLLFDVPVSALAPHQVVTAHRYYRRQGVESVPMSHDLVELYFGRRLGPRLEPLVSKYQQETPASSENWGKHLVELALSNVGGQIARDVMTRLEVVQGVEYSGTSFLNNLIGGPPPLAMTDRLRTHMHREMYWPGLPAAFLSFYLVVPRALVGKDRPIIYLDVFAAESRPIRYAMYLTFQNERMELLPAWEDIGIPPLVV